VINDKLTKNAQNKLSHAFTLNYLNDFDDDIFGNDLNYSNLLDQNQINKKIINLDLEKIDPEDIIKIIYYQEEVSGTDGVGPWLIYKKMRENNVKVSIDGHGADEALGGYSKYLIYALQDVKNDFDLIRYLELYFIKLGLNQTLNFKNLNKIFLNIFFRNKLNRKNSYFNIEKRPPLNYPKDEITKLNNLNFNLYNDFNYTIVPYNLKKFDKYSMAQSVECRNPFLDWRLVSYTFSLPPKSKMGKGFTKRILRDSMKNFVSPKIINRKKKKGFNPTSKHSMLKMRNFINDTVNSQTFRENSIWNSNKIKLDFEKDLFTYQDIFKILQVHYITQTFNEKKN
jgi:asparagine synthase (glutamine-hydrolysing)